MRCTLHLDGLQALEAADAVIDVDDEIAGRQCREFGNEVRGLLGLAAAADETVAQNILFGDDDEVIGLEAFFDSQNDQARDGPVPGHEVLPALRAGEWRHLMVLEDRLEAIARAFRPRGDGNATALRADLVGVQLHRFINVTRSLRTFRRKAAAALAAKCNGRRVRAFEGRKTQHRVVGLHLGPMTGRQIDRLGWNRFIRCGAEGFLFLKPFLAGIEEFGDLLLPRRGRFIRRVVERDDGVVQIIEQRRQMIVEQWQPMFHALIAPSRRNAFIERIGNVDAAESFGIALAKAADRFRIEQHLVGGIERETLEA